MAKGLWGGVTMEKLPFDGLFELHYHTYLIRSGSRTYLFSGAKSSLKDALDLAQAKSGSPYKPKYKKVNA